MTIDNIQSILLIPQFLRDDKSVQGLCAAIDYIFGRLRDGVRRTAIRTNLDYLEDEDLDYVAVAENVFWYKSDDNIDVKRDMIRSYRKIFRLMGTVFAVEKVLRNLFQEDYTILEYMDYEGDPYHFRLNMKDYYGSSEDMKDIVQRIKKAKNVRSVIDGYYNSLSVNQDTYVNFALKSDYEFEIGMEDISEV